MLDNSTIIYPAHYHRDIEIINAPTAINEIASTQYDSQGALFFILIVLLWYAIGVISMLGIQIRARSDTIDDSARRRAKFFLQTLHDQTETKQILEELVDKKNREKLWKIYFGKIDPDDNVKQAEEHRIRNIQKQLGTINRNQIFLNETIRTPIILKPCFRRHSSDIESCSSIERNYQRTRRRSSLDLQIIERWKSLADQNTYQQRLPWPIKKVLISRQFHQHYKRSSLIDSRLIHEHSRLIDDDKCQLITRTGRSDQLSNPYITYFHLPIKENLPLVTMKSNHQIIQIDDDNRMLNFSKV